ncbi:hypothetical protein BD309DRAFT_505331 [Dichomitus squalens]|uniref:Uncharacterized protein n=1 Tax=Dichomitus squalens TaxID=114155 RepID=A0A4Q9PAJ5_9APHY|nr:hypothetical protein BD309DRAFT_505331 [Dichomitus squalens]TBU51684.1 hypothetical protein BD310DRAFT_324989 [Dichomitus squalens]
MVWLDDARGSQISPAGCTCLLLLGLFATGGAGNTSRSPARGGCISDRRLQTAAPLLYYLALTSQIHTRRVRA